MDLPKYDVLPDETRHTYEFVSEGRRGCMYKMVKFQETNLINVYNLGFGDENPITGEIDGKAVSDNGDMEKVLATVTSIIYAFTRELPDKWVYITGGLPTGARLYRIIIMKYLSIVESDFTLRCWQSGEWKDFYPNINCQDFVLKQKNNR